MTPPGIPPAMTDWTPVALGRSGARVLRSPDGATYAKTASSPDVRAELRRERDVLLWLDSTAAGALSVPAVLERDEAGTLLTRTLPGVPLSALGPHGATMARDALVAALSALAALPVAGCPFSRRLADAVPQARERVRAGLVDADDFDDDRLGLDAEAVLALLEDGLAAATAREAGDLAVCHGDLCLPNVHVDPDTGRLAGLLDVGRLGVADRHQDLALADRSLTDPDLNPGLDPGPGPGSLSAAYTAATGLAVDAERLAFYRLLDELF